MTTAPNSPAMEALRKRSKKEDWDGYLTAAEIIDECFKSFCDHIAKLEAERDEALRNFMNATPFSKDEVAKMCSDYTSTIEKVTAERDALRNELEAARKLSSDYIAVSDEFQSRLKLYNEAPHLVPYPNDLLSQANEAYEALRPAPTGVKTGATSAKDAQVHREADMALKALDEITRWPGTCGIIRGCIEAMKTEIDDLQTSVIAFGAPWAAQYAKDHGYPDGHIDHVHYDILKKAGARMVSFTRHVRKIDLDESAT